jgi:hypothetical protein
VRVLRLGLWAYATFLLLGALSGIAYRVYNPVGIEVGYGVFLLLCAALFTWGVTRLRGSAVSQGQGANTGDEPASGPVRRAGRQVVRQVVRQWGMASTGVGAGVVVAMFWSSTFINRFFWSGVLFGPIFFAYFGFVVAACGLVVLLVDGLLRLTGRRYSESSSNQCPCSTPAPRNGEDGGSGCVLGRPRCTRGWWPGRLLDRGRDTPCRHQLLGR